MIRKDFQSIKESISASLSPTDLILLYFSPGAKSVTVFTSEIIVQRFKLSNNQMQAYFINIFIQFKEKIRFLVELRYEQKM